MTPDLTLKYNWSTWFHFNVLNSWYDGWGLTFKEDGNFFLVSLTWSISDLNLGENFWHTLHSLIHLPDGLTKSSPLLVTVPASLLAFTTYSASSSMTTSLMMSEAKFPRTSVMKWSSDSISTPSLNLFSRKNASLIDKHVKNGFPFYLPGTIISFCNYMYISLKFGPL